MDPRTIFIRDKGYPGELYSLIQDRAKRTIRAEIDGGSIEIVYELDVRRIHRHLPLTTVVAGGQDDSRNSIELEILRQRARGVEGYEPG